VGVVCRGERKMIVLGIKRPLQDYSILVSVYPEYDGLLPTLMAFFFSSRRAKKFFVGVKI